MAAFLMSKNTGGQESEKDKTNNIPDIIAVNDDSDFFMRRGGS